MSKSCFLSTFPGPVREWLLDNGEIINAFAQPERERGGASRRARTSTHFPAERDSGVPRTYRRKSASA